MFIIFFYVFIVKKSLELGKRKNLKILIGWASTEMAETRSLKHLKIHKVGQVMVKNHFFSSNIFHYILKKRDFLYLTRSNFNIFGLCKLI